MTARRAVLTLLVVAAIGMFVLAGRNGRSDDTPTITDSAVEELIPADGSPNVLRQAAIGIDLATGWTATLIVNGQRIPEDQLQRVDPLNQVFFTPGRGMEIEKLPPGEVQVRARIWRPSDGDTEADARTISWTFRTA